MFKNAKYYWILMRPVNLGIVGLTQLVFILHASGYQISNIRYPEIIWMVLSVMLTAAAGYVINDIFDIEEDHVNVPELRIVARHITMRNSRVFYAVLLLISLVCGFLSSYSMGFLCLAISIMLYFYSSDLKETTLQGNLLVSFITGAVVFTAAKGVYTVQEGYFAEYAFLAFLISMPREIVKDAEDLEGDKQQEFTTFPIVYGTKNAMYLCMLFLGLLVSSVLFLMARHGNLWYNLWCSLLVFVPVVYLIYLMFQAEVKSDFTRISRLLKLLMVTGLCSVMFL